MERARLAVFDVDNTCRSRESFERLQKFPAFQRRLFRRAQNLRRRAQAHARKRQSCLLDRRKPKPRHRRLDFPHAASLVERPQGRAQRARQRLQPLHV